MNGYQAPQLDKTLTDESSGTGKTGVILSLYFMLKPIYLFNSGLPQLCDFFLLFAFLILVGFYKIRICVDRSVIRWIKVLLFLCFYQFAIDGIWYYRTEDVRMLLKSSYYFFNLFAVLTCLLCYSVLGREKFLDSVSNGCFLSSLVTGIGLILGRSTGVRATGFFNNPNQLGYYAMLMITIVAFFPKRLPKWKTGVVLGVALVANIVSLSKASLIGFFCMAVMYCLFGTGKKGVKRLIIQLSVIALLFAAVYLLLFSESRLVLSNRTLTTMRYRLLNLYSENDSDLVNGRGYGRIHEVGIHFLWGMGEGAFYRFTHLPGREVHSTFVNLFVSYGILGLGGYIYLFFSTINKRGERLRNLACFSGVLLYFVTHNGIRNTVLWILLATLLIYKCTDAVTYSSGKTVNRKSEGENGTTPVFHDSDVVLEQGSVSLAGIARKKQESVSTVPSLRGVAKKKESFAEMPRVSLDGISMPKKTDAENPMISLDGILKKDEKQFDRETLSLDDLLTKKDGKRTDEEHG